MSYFFSSARENSISMCWYSNPVLKKYTLIFGNMKNGRPWCIRQLTKKTPKKEVVP